MSAPDELAQLKDNFAEIINGQLNLCTSKEERAALVSAIRLGMMYGGELACLTIVDLEVKELLRTITPQRIMEEIRRGIDTGKATIT